MKHLGALVVGAWLATVLPALGAPPSILKGLGVDETLDKEAILGPALDRIRLGAADLPVFVRLLVRRADLGATSTDFTRLDARLDFYRDRKIPVVLTLVDPPTDASTIDAWRLTLRALVEHARGKVLAYQVGDRFEGAARPAPKAYAYLVKFVAVQVRSIDDAALIVEGSLAAEGAAAWQEQLYGEDVAAYIDAVALSAPPTDEDRADTEPALAALDGLAEKADPTSALGFTGMVLPSDGRKAAERLVGWFLTHLGGRSSFMTCATAVDTVAAALRAAASIKDVIGGEIVTLDERAASLKLTLKGQDVTATLPHRLLYNMTTFATYLVYWAPAGAGDTVEVSMRLSAPGTPAVRDGAAATTVKVRDVVRDETAASTTARGEGAARPLLLDFNFGDEAVLASRSDVLEHAMPTVDEIVFRYQQAETAQAALIRNYVAHARIDIHFQPSPLDSYDVVLENRFFSDQETSEWEELSFSLNGTRWGRNRPPFPLLQPEKVLSLPLTLRLNRDYVYHLVGLDRVGERPCYLVAFDPIDPTRLLYRGRVWIDTEHYVRLKVQAVQTGLSAPVVSNEEVQSFEPMARVDDRPVYLFSKLTSKQIMLIAGRNLLIEKTVVFSDFHVNDSTFVAEREQARQSDNLMYRDTDKGLRNLVKRGNERVVSDQSTTNAKALAAGVTFDPSYDYPVPLVGIDYLNFNFLHRGLQFGFIFSGVLGGGNLQKANIGGTKFDLSVDFFGIAVTSNDQVYDQHGERKGERLETRPVSTGINVGYQLTDFQKITGSSHVQHDWYVPSAGNTTADFILPVSTTTITGGVNYEYRRSGYSLLGSYAYFRRARWKDWGNGVEFDPATRSYTKYNVGLSKDFYLNPFSKIHLNAAYYGGQREDRFSMYRFGLFDETRIRGVPSAGLRLAEMGLLRASYSFNLLDLFRLAVYMDRAWGHTPFESTWQSTTGIGAEVNFRGPKTTMLKIGVGKAFLPQIYRGSGSMVVELMVFKPI
jgi:hypothetical protein